MAIPQTDGSGRGFSANPYPKASTDSKFESVFVAGEWITRCRKTRRQVIIIGKTVKYVANGHGIQT